MGVMLLSEDHSIGSVVESKYGYGKRSSTLNHKYNRHLAKITRKAKYLKKFQKSVLM